MIYRHIDSRRPDLLLDGKLATKYRRSELWSKLERRKIPGLDPHMGAAELLDCYAAVVLPLARELHGTGDRNGGPIGHEHMWRAAALLDARAAGA